MVFFLAPSSASPPPQKNMSESTTSTMHADGALCYVCLEPTTCRGICDCTVGLHKECQLQLMRRTNTKNCSVCRTEFKNTRIVRHNVLRCDYLWMALCLFVLVVSIMELFLFVFMCDAKYMDCGVAFGFVAVFGVSVPVLMMGLQRYWGGMWVETRVSVEVADDVPSAQPLQP